MTVVGEKGVNGRKRQYATNLHHQNTTITTLAIQSEH